MARNITQHLAIILGDKLKTFLGIFWYLVDTQIELSADDFSKKWEELKSLVEGNEKAKNYLEYLHSLNKK